MKTVISPKTFVRENGRRVFTKGKEYSVINDINYPEKAFTTIDDNGEIRYCLFVNDAHLEGMDWIIK